MSRVEIAGRWLIVGMVSALVMVAVPQVACGSPDPAEVAVGGAASGDEAAKAPEADEVQEADATPDEGPRELVVTGPSGPKLSTLEVHDDLAVREGGSIAWALRKGCPRLKAVVDDFAAEYRVGTLTANVLLERYLESNPWVRNPLAQADRRRFETTFHLFQKYCRKYDFDEIMLTALAYQESRLDQSTRSRAGAVGVMQIKPETAADPIVGIPDVDRLESNIHAGTKYLRFIRDRYFSDPEIDLPNQTLLTFAAYNAGPARVRQRRRDAEARGLDPNVWFGDVEVAAARRVGRETVQYVSNIAKYYVAYRLAVRQMDARAAAEAGNGG